MTPETAEMAEPDTRRAAQAPARRSPDVRVVALLGLLGVVVLTPLILLAGLVALTGLVAIVTGRHVRSLTRPPAPAQLADVVWVDSSAGEIPLSRVA